MEFTRNKLIRITTSIVCITIFIIGFILLNQLLIKLNYFYLFVTIPMLFLCGILSLENIIILFLNIISLIFGRNDNNDVNDFIEKSIKAIKSISKYILIGIFTALLSSIMILDIILCIIFEKYILVAISIVIWILLYYILFSVVVKMIKKEIRL